MADKHTQLFDNEAIFSRVKDSAVGALKEFFPVVGKSKQLVLKDVHIQDDLDPHDYSEQERVKLSGGTWGVPIFADLDLVDKASGQVVDSVKKMKLMTLPKLTNHRYSYIVNGNEYQVINQLRLKPGIYHRIKANEEIEAQVNSAKGRNFKIPFDRDRGIFHLKVGTANIKMYPILRDLGVQDETIEKFWGPDILRANQIASKGVADTESQKLYKNLFYHEKAVDRPQAIEGIRNYLGSMTEFDPDVMHYQLGHPHKSLDPEVFLKSTQKLLKISQGEDEPDDRDSVVVKKILSVDDFLKEKLHLTKSKNPIFTKVMANVDKKERIRDMLKHADINKPIESFFTQSMLSNAEQQINPLHMLSMVHKLTFHGEGGIQSENAVTNEARGVHPTHFGFIDPIQTPEGHNIGAVLHTATGLIKDGNELKTFVINAKTGKEELINPKKLFDSKVAFPDEYDAKLKPHRDKVRILQKGGFDEIHPNDVEYIIPDPKSIFSWSTNMIPFLPSTSGNRALTTSKMQEQALPLLHREVPLVQVHLDDKGSYEQGIGNVYSFKSPISGVVSDIKDGNVYIRSGGKVTKVSTYNNFPLNSKHFLHTDLKVKVGDTVKEGQLLGDSNYTKDGHLTLGTNLRTAYMPWHGYNYEDGVVVSENGAKKLSSMHMHKESIMLDDNTNIDKNLFRAHYPGHANEEHYKKLDEQGVIKIGQIVNPGDMLAASLRKAVPTVEDEIIKNIHKSLIHPWKNNALHWDHDVPGEVVKIGKHGKRLDIYIKTIEPAVIGDKIAGRHGNKGIITRILPNNQMPHDEDGNPMDILLNPQGIPSRMNLGTILETTVAKAAKKANKPFVVQNFTAGNYTDRVRQELKKHGFDDSGADMLYDPSDGKPLGKVMNGHQYIMKLDHSVSKKFNARDFGGYTTEGIPTRGSDEGGQSADPLFLYSMLAHGARENLYDMTAVKAERNDEFWRALQAGRPLPPPKPTFVYDKFLGMLKAIGVNVDKRGNHLMLSPLTDADVLKQSSGAITNARGLLAKNLAEEPGGLFDPKITGGMGGSKWSHIDLAEPFPNPLFEDAIKTLTGINEKTYEGLINGSHSVDRSGEVVSGHEDGNLTGGNAIKALLNKINVKARLKAATEEAIGAPPQKLNKLHKEIRFLKALDQRNLKPDVYMISKIAVLPPKFRPITPQPDGNLLSSDLNYLYKDLFVNNLKLGEVKDVLPEEDVAKVRAGVYQYMQGLSGLADSGSYRKYKGVLDMIRGTSQAKEGLFQSKLVSRRQDLTARSTVVVEPNFGPDEVGLPVDMAKVLYKPFVVRRLVGIGLSPLKAEEELEKGSVLAKAALQHEMKNRPVMLNRAPSLHKFSVISLKPTLVDGHAIKVPPLITAGLGMDFDGDTAAIHIPVTERAREESWKMLPTNHLENPGTGKLMLMPSQEAIIGLYLLTGKGKEVNKSFPSIKEAMKAVKDGDINATDVVRIGGIKSSTGRYLVNQIIPEPYRNYDTQITKSSLTKLMTNIKKTHKNDFGSVVNALKDLGNLHSTKSGYTITLNDIATPTKERDAILAVADKEAAVVKASNLPKHVKDLKLIDIYNKATDKIDEYLKNRDVTGNGLLQSVSSGARGDWTQVRQTVMAPMLLRAGDETVTTPAKRSYSEGLSTADYFIQSFGARSGAIDKSKQTSVPGYFSKRIISANLDHVVTADEDPNDSGIEIDINNDHIRGRFLAQDVPGIASRGDLVTDHVLEAAKRKGLNKISIMSPLTCTFSHGVAAKSVGLLPNGKLPSIGDNIGVMSAQSMSEPTTQMQMKTFHTGGVAKGGVGSNLSAGMERILQLFEMPEIVKGAGTLSKATGKVEKIEEAPQGGHYVSINGVRHYAPATRSMAVKVGDTVERGDLITDGVIKPQELLELKGIRAVQDYLTDEILKTYEDQGIGLRRAIVETAIRPLTNLSRVIDPGSLEEYSPGDYANTQVLAQMQKNDPSIKFEPILKGINTFPSFSNEDWLSQLNTRDLKKVIIQGASRGWSSDIHGTHPIPAYVYGAEFARGDKPWKY